MASGEKQAGGKAETRRGRDRGKKRARRGQGEHGGAGLLTGFMERPSPARHLLGTLPSGPPYLFSFAPSSARVHGRSSDAPVDAARDARTPRSTLEEGAAGKETAACITPRKEGEERKGW